jgi:hypothetical protein
MNKLYGYDLDLFGSRYGLVTGFYAHGKELPRSIKPLNLLTG